MNFSKPISIALLGSVIVCFLVILILFFMERMGLVTIAFSTYLLIGIVILGLTTFVFNSLIIRFIGQRIKFIYRIIGSSPSSEEVNNLGSQDVLAKLTNETGEWADVQKKQIKQLKKQAAFRKEFLGNLAHELKTPVFSIQGYILTLLEGGLEDERVNRDFLERALTGVDRISHLLEDLDEIAKLETDRFELKVKKFDLVHVVKGVFNELETKANEKKIKLMLEKHYEPIFVNADKNRIIQVVVNLVSNSISYGKEGGVTKVSFEILQKNKVLVQVMDNGVGMSQEHIPRLFERFYRVDKSRERNIGGSGLGLAIVKHIIEAHRQTINVKSTEGMGSTFSFTLEKI